MSKNRFRTITVSVILAMLATGFADPRYSLVSLIPWILVGMLAYGLFKYENVSEDGRAMIIGILVLFYGSAYYYFEASQDNKRYMRQILVECQNMHHPEFDHPFRDVCEHAENWKLNRREPTFGRLW